MNTRVNGLRAWALEFTTEYCKLQCFYVKPLTRILADRQHYEGGTIVFSIYESLLASLQTVASTTLTQTSVNHVEIAQEIQREIIPRLDSFTLWHATIDAHVTCVRNAIVASRRGKAWLRAVTTLDHNHDLVAALNYPYTQLLTLWSLRETLPDGDALRLSLVSAKRLAEKGLFDHIYGKLAQFLHLSNQQQYPSGFGLLFFSLGKPSGHRSVSFREARAFIYPDCIIFCSASCSEPLIRALPHISPLHPVVDTGEHPAGAEPLAAGVRLLMHQRNLRFVIPPEETPENQSLLRLKHFGGADDASQGMDLLLHVPPDSFKSWAALLRATGVYDLDSKQALVNTDHGLGAVDYPLPNSSSTVMPNRNVWGGSADSTAPEPRPAVANASSQDSNPSTGHLCDWSVPSVPHTPPPAPPLPSFAGPQLDTQSTRVQRPLPHSKLRSVDLGKSTLSAAVPVFPRRLPIPSQTNSELERGPFSQSRRPPPLDIAALKRPHPPTPSEAPPPPPSGHLLCSAADQVEGEPPALEDDDFAGGGPQSVPVDCYNRVWSAPPVLTRLGSSTCYSTSDLVANDLVNRGEAKSEPSSPRHGLPFDARDLQHQLLELQKTPTQRNGNLGLGSPGLLQGRLSSLRSVLSPCSDDSASEDSENGFEADKPSDK